MDAEFLRLAQEAVTTLRRVGIGPYRATERVVFSRNRPKRARGWIRPVFPF